MRYEIKGRVFEQTENTGQVVLTEYKGNVPIATLKMSYDKWESLKGQYCDQQTGTNQ